MIFGVHLNKSINMLSTYQEEVNSGERFEFGKNWKNFLTAVSESEIKKAEEDIKEWLGTESLTGKRIIDIGSGSGIHSFAFYKMGAKEIVSFDYDDDSVEATNKMWQIAGSPNNWKVIQGSILDEEFCKKPGFFDIVYSWGVLHHTGNMWKAIENAISLVQPDGIFWISIYQKGTGYTKALDLKKKYNNSSFIEKKIMIYSHIFKMIGHKILNGKNPFKWNQKTSRGMNTYHDLVDWLGGLPYEVATKEEITTFCQSKNLKLKKTIPFPEGGCSIYLFTKNNL